MSKKKKDTQSYLTWANIQKYAGSYTLPFILALILATIGSITTILGPDRLSEITDTIAQGLQGTIDTEKN